MITGFSYNKSREEYTLFTDPYYTNQFIANVYGRKSLKEYNGLKDLKGKRVGILKGIFYQEELAKEHGLNLIEFSSVKDIVRKLSEGELDFAVQDVAPFSSAIAELQIKNIKPLDEVKLKNKIASDNRIGVSKDKPILHSILQKGLNSLTTYEKVYLKNKWLLPLLHENRDKNTKVKIQLSAKEQKFIEEHPKIVLGGDSSWEPYIIVNSNGSIDGLDADFIKKINELTGMNVTFELGEWSDMVQKAQNREIDGLTTSAIHKERESYFNFSAPYATLNQVAIVKAGNPKNIYNRDDLFGKKLGVINGNLLMEKYVKSLDNATPIYYDQAIDLLQGLISEEVDAFVTSEISVYIATKEGLRNYIEISSIVGEPTKHVFSLRNDWPELTSIFNKALMQISEKEKQEFRGRWFGQIAHNSSPNQNVIALTKEEQAYFEQKNEISMCVDPNFLPYEKIDEQGKHIGIGSDIIQTVSKSVEKSIKLIPTATWSESLENIKNKKCDILPMAASTADRQKYLNFTEAYINDPVVVVTKEEQFFINDSSDLTNRRIGVVKGYAFNELLKEKNPDIDIVPVSSAEEGLDKVQRGQLYGYVDALPVVAYNIQKDGMLDLKVAGKLEFELELAIASRIDEPLLNSIMQKALDEIAQEQVQAIVGKWFSIKVEQSFDYRILIYISLFFLVVLALVLQRNWAIKKMNRKLEEVSITDNLTQLYNRNKLDEILIFESDRTNRFSSSFGIIIIDMDHFKSVNDIHGHQIGDTVLKEIASILKSHSRKTDIVGRWGGEEFMIICSDTNLDGIMTHAEQLREKISNYPFSLGEQKTASFGVSVYKKDENVDEMIKRADDALYKAKENGRNRVEQL